MRQVCDCTKKSSFSIPWNVKIAEYLTALAEEPNLLSCAFLWERKHLSSFQIYRNLTTCCCSGLQEVGFHSKPRGLSRQLLNLLDSPEKHSDSSILSLNEARSEEYESWRKSDGKVTMMPEVETALCRGRKTWKERSNQRHNRLQIEMC